MVIVVLSLFTPDTLYQWPYVFHTLSYRRFDQLSELMSEEDNCQVYQTEIEKLLKSESSFIPFLGSFLTQVGFLVPNV